LKDCVANSWREYTFVEGDEEAMTNTQNLSVADRLEIYELVARYNRAIDAGPEARWASEWVNTFAPDAEFDCALGIYRGHKELYECHHFLYTDAANTDYLGGQHWLHNIILTPTASGADLWADFLLFMPGKPVPFVSLIGSYSDELVSFDGRWRFSRRRVTLVR
jgi:hypothetical protein